MSELVGPPFRSVCTADRGVNTQVCEHLAKVVLTRVNTWQKWVLIQLYEQCVNVNPGALPLVPVFCETTAHLRVFVNLVYLGSARGFLD